MNTTEARNALLQFQRWTQAAEKMREVVDNATHFEQLAKESERRYKALEDQARQLKDTEAKLKVDINDLREQKQSFKLSMENETNRLKERHRVERDRLGLELRKTEEETTKRVEALQAQAKAVEDECKVRERRAKEAAAKAEDDLQKLRKRLGAV